MCWEGAPQVLVSTRGYLYKCGNFAQTFLVAFFKACEGIPEEIPGFPVYHLQRSGKVDFAFVCTCVKSLVLRKPARHRRIGTEVFIAS